MLRVTVEPEESAVMSGRPAGTHHIEGGGVGFIPPLLEDGGWDEVIAVSTADAGDMARKAAPRGHLDRAIGRGQPDRRAPPRPSTGGRSPGGDRSA